MYLFSETSKRLNNFWYHNCWFTPTLCLPLPPTLPNLLHYGFQKGMFKNSLAFLVLSQCGAPVANVALLFPQSLICGPMVAKVALLVAHCTLHSTEGMAICFNISLGSRRVLRLRTTTLVLEGTTIINRSNPPIL